MEAMRAWTRGVGALFVVESRLFLREPIAAFFTFAFPVLLFVLFALLFGEMPLGDEGVLTYADFYAPALMGAFVAQAGLVNLASFLASYRELGILKRYVVSPLSPGSYLLVHTATHFVALTASSLLLAAVAEVLFDIAFPGSVVVVLLAGMVSVACFFTLGFLIGGRLRSRQGALALGQFLFLTMFFLSGAAFPRALFPEWLQALSLASPLTHAVELFAGVWLGDPLSRHAASLAVLLGITLVGYPVAVRTFRWEM